MYPILFHVGGFTISSFGVMVSLGALAGLWLLMREIEARSLPANSIDAAIVGVFGGIAGAKLLFVAEHLGQAPFFDLLLDRGGLSWFGGLAGGIGLGLLVLKHRKVPLLPVLAAAAPAFAIGQGIGRLGCFLVGDDYGIPTSLPWGVAFPKGLPPTTVPVHPTQLYEAAFLAVLAFLLVRWRRKRMMDHMLLARYLILAGGFRFALEFIRINPRVALGMTVAQFACLGLIAAGMLLWMGGTVLRPLEQHDTTHRIA